MTERVKRRWFLQRMMAAATIASFPPFVMASNTVQVSKSRLISPGSRRSKVKVAKLYLGTPQAHWPTPLLDLKAERDRYEGMFRRMKEEFADVDFTVNALVTTPEQVNRWEEELKAADGILLIHLSMGIGAILREVLKWRRPTMLFAAPYSGHEWAWFGRLRSQPEGELFDCILSSDLSQLATAIRPFRAIHHLREAKILDITARPQTALAQAVKERFGTEYKAIERERVLQLYQSVPDAEAFAEAKRWIAGAEKVVEPSREEIIRSCKLALAFQRLLDEEEATVLMVDCFGTMWRQLPAYPCIGFCQLNNTGFGGICESDFLSAIVFIIFQGLSGRPSFIANPTIDLSKNGVILAHCLGTTMMDGLRGKPARYRLRSIMERQEGVVPQVFMRVGQKVTVGASDGVGTLLVFTGTIVETPDSERGCRTQIVVTVDGDLERLWQNWRGWHRVVCYGDLMPDLRRFCRFTKTELVSMGA